MQRLNTSESELEVECPSIEIAAYLDGELSTEAEAKLEAHLSNCSICTRDLNDQKHFLNALNGSLNYVPEIPADFTKRIVTNAESGVSGLRQKRERLNAVFVCVGLFFFALFTLGASAPGTITASFDIVGRMAAVLVFASHLVYDISIGAVIIMRSLAGQPAFVPVALVLIVPMIVGIAYKYSHFRSGRGRSDYLESGSRS
jgi:predicted anti-sigma-YlaC factor YlaD